MKTIGLIGGLSWESSIEYYRIINEAVQQRLGGLSSGKILMVSVNFAEIESLRHQNRWGDITEILVNAAKTLELGGADFLLLCTNTMHKMASEIQSAVKIPFIHIADPTAAQIKARGLTKIGLLGTRITMEEDFYKGRLANLHGLSVFIPESADRQIVNRVIYEELVLGKIDHASLREYIRIINDLAEKGAQGIILGCTEIGLLVKPEDTSLPLFDTTQLHAMAAVNLALE